jgi:hypothetical protein
MPIKFRCEHCHQLLGISRSKAGKVADCPTCGRSVRVPELDGRRDPVPPPQLDLNDSRLAGALDELAQIGLEPDEAAPAAAEPDHAPPTPEVISPEPLASPVAIEPPAPVKPQEVPVSTPQPAMDRSATNDALSELARGGGSPTTAETSPPAAMRQRRKSLFSLPVAGMLFGAVVVGFGLGFLVGQRATNDSASTTNGNGNGNGAEHAAPANGEDTATLAIQGRITYENEDGDRRPDRQARVLVFPQQRSGQRKLDITGLRASDSPEDFRSAAAAFRALGGDVTLVDEDGNFTISLPAAGTYHILVLSNYQPRDTDEAIEASLLNLLSQYFDRAEQLLGRAAFHSAQIRYKGAEPEVWDHSF